jgi:flagellar motor switch protein FliN
MHFARTTGWLFRDLQQGKLMPESGKDKSKYLECWISVATSLFSQALVGEPILAESLPKPMAAGSFGFVATIAGDEEGRFTVMLDAGLAEASLLGEGIDQRLGWTELLREVAEAAAGELLAKTGRKCQIVSFAPAGEQSKLARALQLNAGDRSWSIQLSDEVRVAGIVSTSTENIASVAGPQAGQTPKSGLSPGLDLLLDVELEAALRFGGREMPLGEILDLGPGDVVQLDRHINDPVDLIVGDKIVARGEVVLINGNFGLRVTEVAEPQRRLESIRCLF